MSGKSRTTRWATFSGIVKTIYYRCPCVPISFRHNDPPFRQVLSIFLRRDH